MSRVKTSLLIPKREFGVTTATRARERRGLRLNTNATQALNALQEHANPMQSEKDESEILFYFYESVQKMNLKSCSSRPSQCQTAKIQYKV